jgi:hypothetical protein
MSLARLTPDDVAAECRVLLAEKQREVSELRTQAQQRPPSPDALRDESEREGESEAGATTRKTIARPFTADELNTPPRRRHLKMHPESADQGSHSGVALNIQSWWSGEGAVNGDHDSSSSPRQQLSLIDSPPLEHVEVPKRCGTSSDSVRPLRARLVGLLAALEEETSAFRGLIATETPVADKGWPLSLPKKSGRRTLDLPALSGDRRSIVSPTRAERSLKTFELVKEGSITCNRST